MAVTLTDLNTIYSVVLNNVSNIQNSDITSANPSDISTPAVVSTASSKTVTAGSISAVSITPFTNVTFSTVSTTDEITNESLNRNATSLASSVNTQMGAFTSSITLAVNGLKGDVATSINTLTSDINNKLASLKSEQDTQVSGINSQLSNLATDINNQIDTIRSAESQQSSDIASKINILAGELTANIALVKDVADNAQLKISELDNVYGTDSQMAVQVANIDALINTLRGSDVNFLTAVNGAIDEINGMTRTFSKEILVSAGNGVYTFSNLAEGAGDFVNASDYVVEVEAIGNFKTRASLENKTKDGFDVRVISHGVHFVPQPVDCSVTPVKVTVTMNYAKKNPLTFNVDTLNSSFISNGAGTDTNIVGAMVLSNSTLSVSVGSQNSVTAMSATAPLNIVVLDTNVATAVAVGSQVNVTGVSAGTTTVTITDATNYSVTLTVTVIIPT